MESDRARVGRDGGMTEPLRILMTPSAVQQAGTGLADALGGRAHMVVNAGDDADIAFVSRDVTGLSTKHQVLPHTQQFHDALRSAPSLRWVHAHSSGADRPVYGELRARGVEVTTSSGANAGVVVQTALAGVLMLARCFPQLLAAQREKTWAPLVGSGLPRDLAGQTAVIVGWGPIGQGLGALLSALGLRVVAVRTSAGADSVRFEDIHTVLPRADWLLLACPLTDRTRGLVNAAALALLPHGARLVNVSRGEVVDEPALIAALRSGALSGAYLDVFAHEPLPADSPLWDMPNVIVTPHTAGHSDGNEARVAALFLDNLKRWNEGQPLLNRVA
ncbi:phosphoglycerate dehydrogenase-like enzyme [Variovorax boronicumulans]|uniref:Phosphoglycerate dehydrogenase-like enzyme n=2 Tax=Comamonadaceae TaxID=80864 RepID=A0AAW8CTF2_9BURK|nr:phosphoglycerate dehydrogenase-like enzyme [Variovorax boronicumulans]MDQ0034942.1 phosphoglycerate dehydrogenase-like enzyme [Variovorax boronicumulans]MDQ0053526.1 phosphoglycerate dehydrogenase-like enzyme [Variovorax boronicumulans]